MAPIFCLVTDQRREEKARIDLANNIPGYSPRAKRGILQSPRTGEAVK